MDALILVFIAVLVIVAALLFFAFEVTESQKDRVAFEDATICKVGKVKQIKTKRKKAHTDKDYKSLNVNNIFL